MFLVRRVAAARREPAIAILFRRTAPLSTDSHGGLQLQHGEDYHSKEGFRGPLWRNVMIFSALAAAAYKYAPEPTDDVYLTRWIALYTTPRDLWLDLNARHTALEQDSSEASLLLSDAKMPRVHRYRYPQSLDQVSPFLTPVGMAVDTRNFLVKGDRE